MLCSGLKILNRMELFEKAQERNDIRYGGWVRDVKTLDGHIQGLPDNFRCVGLFYIKILMNRAI